jgi:hypothetical protein
MKFRRLALALLITACSWGVQASPHTDALARCLADNTTGKDRKDLARWIFLTMSTQLDIGSAARVDPASIPSAQRTVAELATHLLAESWSRETAAVVEADGASGVGMAFEYLGKLAMQELMSNREVNASISGVDRFLDKNRIERAVKAK